MERSDAEIASYELPDDDRWPGELSKYRQDVPNVKVRGAP